MKYTCPVCGYKNLNKPPYRAQNGLAFDSSTGEQSYGICSGCGFEFGVSDDDLGYTFERWRREWIAKGMLVESRYHRPIEWNPKANLAKLTENGVRVWSAEMPAENRRITIDKKIFYNQAEQAESFGFFLRVDENSRSPRNCAFKEFERAKQYALETFDIPSAAWKPAGE